MIYIELGATQEETMNQLIIETVLAVLADLTGREPDSLNRHWRVCSDLKMSFDQLEMLRIELAALFDGLKIPLDVDWTIEELLDCVKRLALPVVEAPIPDIPAQRPQRATGKPDPFAFPSIVRIPDPKR